MIKKFAYLFIALLCLMAIGCGTAGNVTGPDITEQTQSDDPAQKPPVPVDGDPDSFAHKGG